MQRMGAGGGMAAGGGGGAPGGGGAARAGVDWGRIEAKWRSRWQEGGDFEADPGDRPKRFITVAYPYPNSPQHIGHGRTYTLADVHARFRRMRGDNVLFPMAFHYTGTPILGMARRVEAGEEELIGNLRDLYGVPDEAIRGFADPVKIAGYFHQEIKSGMIEMGYSIDWRREFTTVDPAYKRFIEWQISTLREKGLIIQGSHPVGWCQRDQNPVSQHDTLGDVEPGFTEYVLVKFRFGGYTIPTATLRPETVFGVTNLWVNPGTAYLKVLVDGERWIVSEECAYKMGFQGREVSREGEIMGSELVGGEAEGPGAGGGGGGRPVVMLPASFVESGTGTGIVMSVPAHAPFDYQALKDLKAAAGGLDPGTAARARAIEPIPVIETEGYGRIPAEEAVARAGASGQDDPRLEEATKEVYSKEFYGGRMMQGTGRFAGAGVARAKDEVGEWLAGEGAADTLLELTSAPVRCRCGAECVVKVLSDQWFLNYGDAAWKESANRCLASMSVLPQEIRGEFQYVVGWLRERACARQHGLGTKLPWDEGWVVESLSDSVIYMAYYTISRFVNDGTVDAGSLSRGFFDYVFLRRGEAADVSRATGIPAATLDRIRGEFEYFYPVDSRHSGRDLVPNHLTFFVLNHAAIFPERHWPKEIVVNGSVLMDGSKMSKSMGNIIPLRRAIRDHGADPIRLAIITSAELLQDADFNLESVSGIRSRLEGLLRECTSAPPPAAPGRGDPGGGAGQEPEDAWIRARTRSLIAEVTSSIERMRLREALHCILFSFESDLGWHAKRAGAKGRGPASGVVREVNSVRVALLSPFAPHAAEEMWEGLGNARMVSRSGWPESAPAEGDADSVQSEELLRSVLADIENILRVTKISPKRITVYTAGRLKSEAYYAILGRIVSGGETRMGEIMKALAADERTREIRRDPGFVQKAIKDILSDPAEIREARLEAGARFDEKSFMEGELACLARGEFGVEDVRILAEDGAGAYDPKGKARHARPFKPALLVE